MRLGYPNLECLPVQAGSKKMLRKLTHFEILKQVHSPRQNILTIKVQGLGDIAPGSGVHGYAVLS